MTGRRGRRSKQQLDDLKERTGSWKLKKETLAFNLWGTSFEIIYVLFTRETAMMMNFSGRVFWFSRLA